LEDTLALGVGRLVEGVEAAEEGRRTTELSFLAEEIVGG